MLIRLTHTHPLQRRTIESGGAYVLTWHGKHGPFCTSHPVVVKHLASIPSLCLEPDAHVRISANDAAWSACQSESKSHGSSGFGCSSSSCMCQPDKHVLNNKLQTQPESAKFLLYQTEEGQTWLEGAFRGETCWFSLNLLAELFSGISRSSPGTFRTSFPRVNWRKDQLMQFLQ